MKSQVLDLNAAEVVCVGIADLHTVFVEEVTIDVLPLDQILRDYKIDTVDLLLIDTEGWEPDVRGLSRCPRLADMWYGGLAHPAEGTGATGACNGEGANSDGIPGWFPGRGELRGIPV